jgi:hypothetical protein
MEFEDELMKFIATITKSIEVSRLNKSFVKSFHIKIAKKNSSK